MSEKMRSVHVEVAKYLKDAVCLSIDRSIQ